MASRSVAEETGKVKTMPFSVVLSESSTSLIRGVKGLPTVVLHVLADDALPLMFIRQCMSGVGGGTGGGCF